MENLLTYFEVTTADVAGSLREGGHVLAAGATYSRLIEASAKMTNLIEAFDVKGTQLRSGSATQVEWIPYDVDALTTRATQIRRKAVIALMDSVLQLPSGPPPVEIPDLLGQAFHVACVEAYDAAEAGDANYFAALAKRLPSLARIAIRRTFLVLEKARWQIGCGQIAADLLELSSYAMLYSELNGKDLWTDFREAWTALIAEDPKLFDSMIALAYYVKRLPALTTQGILRTNWTQTFEERLVNLQLLQQRSFAYDHGDDTPIIVRRNSTLRAVLDTRHSQTIMLDVFVVRFALRHGVSPTNSTRSAVDAFLLRLAHVRTNPSSREQRARRERQRARRRW